MSVWADGRRWVALLVGVLAMPLTTVTSWAAPAPEAWALWDDHAPDDSAHIDHRAWQEFLDGYLLAGPDGVNRVAYGAVTPEDRQRLQSYLQALADMDPRHYAKAEQMAYWINLYNALTVEVVLSYPGKGSILRMGKKRLAIGPWDDKLVEIAGEAVSLNDIEHRILRPIFRDHRIHYAVNCASISCPNLVPEAYTRDNIERLLAANEVSYINHQRGVRFAADGRLVLSQIFQWYRDDFAADREALLAYLSRHHGALAQALVSYDGRIKYAYDWTLNSPQD